MPVGLIAMKLQKESSKENTLLRIDTRIENPN